MSGNINNQSDIYLLGANSDNIKKITDDSAHDIFPIFLQNSTSIVFSSNRVNTDLTKSNRVQTSDNYNIFLYNLDTTSNKLLALTNDESLNIKSKSISNRDLLFLSDKKGKRNSATDCVANGQLGFMNNDEMLDLEFDTKGGRKNPLRYWGLPFSCGEVAVIIEPKGFKQDQYRTTLRKNGATIKSFKPLWKEFF